MAGTITLTVQDHAGVVIQYVQARVYDQFGVFGGSLATDATGKAVFTLPAGTYQIALEETRTNSYPPQWVGPHGVGVATQLEGDKFVLADAGALTPTVKLETADHMFGAAIDGAVYSFWKDTSAAGAVLRLLPGEERRPFSGDKTDPLYKHVLVGPFLTAAKASAA